MVHALQCYSVVMQSSTLFMVYTYIRTCFVQIHKHVITYLAGNYMYNVMYIFQLPYPFFHSPYFVLPPNILPFLLMESLLAFDWRMALVFQKKALILSPSNYMDLLLTGQKPAEACESTPWVLCIMLRS